MLIKLIIIIVVMLGEARNAENAMSQTNKVS